MPSYIEEFFAPRISRFQEISCFHKKSVKDPLQPIFAGRLHLLLIPLDKNPGIRPIGVGEVMRRIVEKTIAEFLKEEIKDVAGHLQVCAGHSAGLEAAIHAMSQVFVYARNRWYFTDRSKQRL